MTRRTLLSAAILIGLLGLGAGSACAQDWTDYLHWPYVPPQYPGHGFEYNSLHDGWYAYPREERIVPQIQGPYYRNFYGGQRLLGFRQPAGWEPSHWWWKKMNWYEGNHFALDVF